MQGDALLMAKSKENCGNLEKIDLGDRVEIAGEAVLYLRGEINV